MDVDAVKRCFNNMHNGDRDPAMEMLFTFM